MKCDFIPMPREGYAIILPDAEETVTAGGIHLAEGTDLATDKLRSGKIVRLGEHQFIGYRKDGGAPDRKPCNLAKKQQVVYNAWSGDVITVDDVDYILVRHDEIVAIEVGK